MVDRSENRPAFLPPTDHVARVLLKRGARDEAVALLRAAVARDPKERACAALLRAVEARPDASVYGPELAIDLSIVEAYARSGMLLEALAVLRGAGLESTIEGRHRQAQLEELLAPCEDRSDQELLQVDEELRNGGAAVALSLLAERLARHGSLPPQARRRHEILSELLIEGAEEAERLKSEHPIGRSPFATALARHLSRRDVDGALRTAREQLEQSPADLDARAVVEALERLVAAMKKASADMSGGSTFSTQPMTGHTVALFQLRMGNLSEAERYFRKLVLEEPLDDVARARLEDVQTVRRVIDGPLAPPDLAPMPAQAEDPEVDPFQQTGLSMPSLGSLLDTDTTNRVVGSEEAVAETHQVERSPDGPSTVQVSLSDVTRQVDYEAYEEARNERSKPSSPQLLKKSELRVTPSEGWGAGLPRIRADEWEEEPSTEVSKPEQEAELLLLKGYGDRALELYDSLVRSFPHDASYRKRRDEIRALLSREEDPPTSVGVVLEHERWMDDEEEEETTATMSADAIAAAIPAAAAAAAPEAGPEPEAEPTRVSPAPRPSPADDRMSGVRVARIITIE